MTWPFVIAAVLLSMSVAHAEVAGGRSSPGQTGSGAVARPDAATPLTNQRDFGALPGAPGSPTYDPYVGLPSNGALGTSPTIPTNPSTGLPLADSPELSTPSLDEVMPGATNSGLLQPFYRDR